MKLHGDMVPRRGERPTDEFEEQWDKYFVRESDLTDRRWIEFTGRNVSDGDGITVPERMLVSTEVNR